MLSFYESLLKNIYLVHMFIKSSQWLKKVSLGEHFLLIEANFSYTWQFVSGHSHKQQSLQQNQQQERGVRKTVSCGDAPQTNKRTTVKISSHRNSNVSSKSVGNSRQNRTKVFIASNSQHEDRSTEEKKETFEELNSNNSSFDSGYFGTNSSPPIQDDTFFHHGNNEVKLKTSGSWSKQKNEPLEIHSVKYRCIPVYQPEIVKTGKLHGKESLSVINENEHSIPLHKKWGSQTIEPTQEPFGYVPRSAVLINNIKEKFRKERERKMDLIKRDSVNHRSPSKEFKQTRTSSSKQFPIEKTVVGSQSPKFHKKAAYGMMNYSRGSNTHTPCNSSTVYDAKAEKSKVAAFAHALENAAWRKKSVAGHCWKWKMYINKQHGRKIINVT